jgi:hypothetical protein
VVSQRFGGGSIQFNHELRPPKQNSNPKQVKPLGESPRFYLLSHREEGCVEASAKTLKKRFSVGEGDVNEFYIPLSNDPASSNGIQRQAKASGKIIERANRDHTQRKLGSDQFLGHTSYGTVPAGSSDPMTTHFKCALRDLQ